MFKVGDRVKLSTNSRFWVENTASNPRNVEGVVSIIDYSFDFEYRVCWDGGRTNCYNEGDLELVQPAKPKGISAFIKKWEKEYSNVKTA